MLSFDSSLTDALNTHSTEAFWVLKLYYNDESSFYGVSDQDRTDGSDIYYGLVSSWGNLQQSLNFFNFTTSTGNISVKLINTDNSIKGGRFSDLFSSNNYANRKWELFQNTAQAGTYDTAARMIGTGIISGDIAYDTKSVKFTLLDMSGRYYKTIPRSVVNSTDHSNAPDKNLTMPLPIAYGDFHEKDDVGTIPTTNFDRFVNFYKGAFPAIITDEWNATNGRIEAACDIMSVNTLDADNVYGHFKNAYAECDTSTITANSATVTATGDDWRLYVPLQSHSVYASGGGSEWSNYDKTIDDDFGSGYVTLTASGSAVAIIGWRIPKVEKLGTFTSASLLMSFSNGVGSPEVGFDVKAVGTAGGGILQTIVSSGGAMSGANGEQIEIITGLYGGTDSDEWDLEDEVFLVLDDTGGIGAQNIRIHQVGIMIEFKPEDGFEAKMNQSHEYIVSDRVVGIHYSKSESAGTVILSKRKIVSSVDVVVPAIASYLFYSGEGRKYGAWIDSNTDASTARTNGLDKGDIIESPIYIIEDLLRTECGTITKGTADTNTTNKLVDSGTTFPTDVVGQCAYNLTDGTSEFITARDDANTLSLGSDAFPDGNEDYYVCGLTDDEIDTATFDTAGNTASSAGKVYNALGGVASTSEWAFAQMKFTGIRDLIVRISRQCGAYVFIGGDGKFKIKTLQRSGYSEDKTIDFNDINLKDIKLTPLDNVRNDFTINYNKDYAKDQYQNTVTDSDATSQGTGSTGYNQILKLELDADVVSSTTASQIAATYKEFFKDRHITISFDCLRSLYNDLEIGDIIKFSNWDSNIKIYGTAMGTDYYMITDISKSPNKSSLKTIKVS